MLYEKIEFEPNIPIKYRLISLDEYPFHMHSNVLEIIFCVEGYVELNAVNTVIQMKEGDIYICSPNELHYLCGQGASRPTILQIYLDESAYKREFPDIDTYQFANGALENNRQGIRVLGNHIIKRIAHLINESSDKIDYYKEGAEIIKILVQYFQCYSIVKYYPELSDAFKGNEVQLSRIRRIVDYIYMNCNKPIKIEDVANMEHISTSYLTYILKIGCGMGFRMFLNMARVEKSAAMLLEDEMSMQKIAYECGFSKYEYYNETFKKVFRVTPKQYKQKNSSKTIANIPVKVREQTSDNLRELTKKFYVRNEEIVLDMKAKHVVRDVFLPTCINLSWGQYDHIYNYQFLANLKVDLAVETVGLNMEYINRFKNKPHVLKSIFVDLWKLGYTFRIYVDDHTDVSEFKEFIYFINCFLEAQPIDIQNKIEFAIKSDGKDGFDNCAEMYDYITAEHFKVFFMENNSLPIEELKGNTDCILCFILNLIFEKKRVLEGNVNFISDEPYDSKGQVALLSDNGVKYPLYYLFRMMKRMGRQLIKQGNGYMITKKHKDNDIQVLIFDPAGSDNYFSSREGELTIENFFGDFALKKYRFSPMEYLKKAEKLLELNGKMISDELMELIDGNLAPETSISIVKPNGSFRTNFKIEPHEILLLSFEELRE